MIFGAKIMQKIETSKCCECFYPYLTSFNIAREMKDKIEAEMQYPGTIKITVIRETRALEEAK